MRRSRRIHCALALTATIAATGLGIHRSGLPWQGDDRPNASEWPRDREARTRDDSNSADIDVDTERTVREIRIEARARAERICDAARSSTGPAPPRDPDGSSRENEPRPIFLDVLSLAPRALSLAPTGFDAGAPRRLTLWRVDDEQAARLARTRSQPDGSFVFGQMLVPLGGLRLVVTAEDRRPDAAERSRAPTIPGPLPPPHVTVQHEENGEWTLSIEAALPDGRVHLAAQHDDLEPLASFSLPDAGSPPLELTLAAFEDETEVWVAHELANGRTSEWVEVPLSRALAPMD